MASYLRPRRGKQATAVSQNVVLRRGEIFFEVPDTGVGTGNGKIKMGDGTTAYSALPYFMEPTRIDVATSTIEFTEATETDNAVLLSAIASGAQLKTLIGNIKKLLSNLNTSVTQLNNDLANIGDISSHEDRIVAIESMIEEALYEECTLSGSGSITTGSNTYTNVYKYIEFSKPFVEIPTITIKETSGSSTQWVGYSDVTCSGFYASASSHYKNVSVPFSWTATGKVYRE